MKMNDVNNIKKLMQEHVKQKEVSKDVDSPYAKYNSRGQLTCIVCGVPVKNKIIWQAHINKKNHKDNLAKLKEKQEKISQLPYQKHERVESNKHLRFNDIEEEKPAKKPKLQKPKGILKNINTYSSSEESEDDQPPIKGEFPVKLEPSVEDNANVAINVSESQNEDTTALPEGFFDDPVQDAKARKVEYRDKAAMEWESFVREVSEATERSKELIAEDKEEAALQTQITQAEEQMRCLEKVVVLDREKRNHISEKAAKSHLSRSSDEESSDEEFSAVFPFPTFSLTFMTSIFR